MRIVLRSGVSGWDTSAMGAGGLEDHERAAFLRLGVDAPRQEHVPVMAGKADGQRHSPQLGFQRLEEERVRFIEAGENDMGMAELQ